MFVEGDYLKESPSELAFLELNPSGKARIRDSVGNGTRIQCLVASNCEISQGRYSIALTLVQGVLTPLGLSVPAAVRRSGGMTAHAVEYRTSHCAQARQGWRSCSSAW